MKRLTALFVGFLAGAMTVICSTYGQKNESPLMAPYTPTRLEWLAVDLESRFKSGPDWNAPVSGVDYTAIAPDTILVSVMYTANAPAGAVDAVVKQSEEFVKKDALSYGWSKWLKIRVERKQI